MNNKYHFLTLGLLIAVATLMSSMMVIKSKVDEKSKWKLQWADEFDYEGLPNSRYWGYNVGGHGWGNNELQYYTEADTNNVMVKNGYLWIKALKGDKEGRSYTSARLVTKNKVDILYGKVEVSAKLPKGRGLWPAIWMLSSTEKYGGWPKNGEIDIMEHVGFNPDTVFGSVHTERFNHVIGTQKTKGVFIREPYARFHTYAIEWTPKRIDFLLDGKKYYSFKNTGKGFREWPFDQAFHLLLNIAVGGGWGGQRGIDNSVFPGVMQIDYVRYYRME